MVKDDANDIARANWERYVYGRDHGHEEYCQQARRCEDFYLGAGLQWDEQVRRILESEGRPAHEVNEIMPAVNAAVGYQIANRMDVLFVPRSGDASAETAKVLTKLVRHILDVEHYRWRETDVYEDGLIMQRGYFDVRLRFSDSLRPEIEIRTLDPMDVIPDPDAKSYDPDEWADVIITRWLTADEIRSIYGDEAARQVEALDYADEDFGEGASDDGVPRSRFGATAGYDAVQRGPGRIPRYRIIDRQHWQYTPSDVAIYPTGDIRVIEGATDEQRAAYMASGAIITRRPMRRVRWTVTATDRVVLHDDWSPFRHFTIVPFFPYFRRGRTRGLVDNAISSQELKNKALSQYIHIVNTSANSGWLVPFGTLRNMTDRQLEEWGARSGLTIVYDPTMGKPEKIPPNPMPVGVEGLIQHATQNIRATTGVNEALLGIGNRDNSGVLFQSRQYAAAQGLARPLDNLARTRYILATRLLDIIQQYYIDHRIYRITGIDVIGRPYDETVEVNAPTDSGAVVHDLTVGEYDIVITDVPMHVTYDQTQFEQIVKMRREMGVAIPDSVVIR
ncbi:MAG: genomic island protein, partial [Dehalococcoidia bacterium]|nr:genomic island protein [Dehalococcoidia bacterium]